MVTICGTVVDYGSVPHAHTEREQCLDTFALRGNAMVFNEGRQGQRGGTVRGPAPHSFPLGLIVIDM